MSDDVAEAFGSVRRFHVYDHGAGEWVMSGADFGHAVAVDVFSEGDGQLEALKSPPDTDGDLSVVWEDGEDQAVEEVPLDGQTSEEVADAALGFISAETGIERSRLQLVSVESPGRAKYFKTAPEAEDIIDDGRG